MHLDSNPRKFDRLNAAFEYERLCFVEIYFVFVKLRRIALGVHWHRDDTRRPSSPAPYDECGRVAERECYPVSFYQPKTFQLRRSRGYLFEKVGIGYLLGDGSFFVRRNESKFF